MFKTLQSTDLVFNIKCRVSSVFKSHDIYNILLFLLVYVNDQAWKCKVWFASSAALPTFKNPSWSWEKDRSGSLCVLSRIWELKMLHSSHPPLIWASNSWGSRASHQRKPWAKGMAIKHHTTAQQLSVPWSPCLGVYFFLFICQDFYSIMYLIWKNISSIMLRKVAVCCFYLLQNKWEMSVASTLAV